MKDTYSYIEFEIDNLTRFERLKTLFLKLKEVKDNQDCLDEARYLELKQNGLDYIDPVDNFPWQFYLDDQALEWFANTFDFNSYEGVISGNWYFESMLDAIFNANYALVDLIIEKDNQGCLYYNPCAFPFGSSDSLVELIKSFGNQITYNSRHKFSTPVIKSEWDYELAKKLVKQGTGFTPELLHNWKIL